MCTFEQYVPAPYLRKEFELAREAEAAELLICGLGFYRLFINGTEITKAFWHLISAIRIRCFTMTAMK